MNLRVLWVENADVIYTIYDVIFITLMEIENAISLIVAKKKKWERK